MPSEFYLERFERKIPLTGMFLERMGKLISAAGEVDDEGMVEIIAQAMVDAGLVEEPTDEAVAGIIVDLNAIYGDKKDKKEEEDKPTGKGKHFAGYFAEWASSLSFDKLCFYAAGFDYAKAREYFVTLDQRSVVAIADEKLRLEFELARVSFEAALFGFGGGYKNTPREGESVFDLSSGGQDAEKALKNLGF